MRFRSAGAAVCAALGLAGLADAQLTERVNLATGGAQAQNSAFVDALCTLSADGRCAAFQSYAANLVSGDTNAKVDIFVRDRLTAQTERVSVGPGGIQSNGDCWNPALSADGRFVAFEAASSTLVPGVGGVLRQIYLRDRLNAATELVSVSNGGIPAQANVYDASLSADGRWVAFRGNGLDPADLGQYFRIYLRDRQTAQTILVSRELPGATYDGHSSSPALSADGRCLCFVSDASTLVAGDSNGKSDVFVFDRLLGTTELVSDAGAGVPGNGHAISASISQDGRFVAFSSAASNLVAGDTNSRVDVFVRDRQSGQTSRVSLASGGGQSDADSLQPTLSAEGRWVAFVSQAHDLVPPDPTLICDVYLHDCWLGGTTRISVSSEGVLGDGPSLSAAISADGRYVAYRSDAANLVAGDTNGTQDVFVSDLRAAGFTRLCLPGIDGVRPCPCANPPAGADRGCENSAATGGAGLDAGGFAYLAQDSLAFTITGETSSATSILLQGDALVPAGVVFGQGVRCVGGALKRLYTKSAVAGALLVPDPGAGDARLSERSAALGDPLSGGATRYYLAYYRDPLVLGGCAATSTFNATPTGRVTWWP